MTDRIPEGIPAEDIVNAIRKIESGAPSKFASSTRYDVLFEGKRFAPKAVVGIASAKVLGEELTPYDFKGGLKSKCFRVLERNGFEIVTKGDVCPFPEEVDDEFYFEGGLSVVKVNRYERNTDVRKKCIKHYGISCQVCRLAFYEKYGAIGEEFIHVHHIVPIASISHQYIVDPIRDLRPVCPNCHAMLHKRQPPFTIEELRDIVGDKS